MTFYGFVDGHGCWFLDAEAQSGFAVWVTVGADLNKLSASSALTATAPLTGLQTLILKM